MLPYILSGISSGGQYALIAIGYTLVYGILRLINFAHGDVFMVAGLIMVYSTTSMPLYLSIPLVLGSWLSFALLLLYPVVIVLRIRNEEALLEAELAGYSEYKQKVKFRLFPGIW